MRRVQSCPPMTLGVLEYNTPLTMWVLRSNVLCTPHTKSKEHRFPKPRKPTSLVPPTASVPRIEQ